MKSRGRSILIGMWVSIIAGGGLLGGIVGPSEAEPVSGAESIRDSSRAQAATLMLAASLREAESDVLSTVPASDEHTQAVALAARSEIAEAAGELEQLGTLLAVAPDSSEVRQLIRRLQARRERLGQLGQLTQVPVVPVEKLLALEPLWKELESLGNRSAAAPEP